MLIQMIRRMRPTEVLLVHLSHRITLASIGIGWLAIGTTLVGLLPRSR